MKYKCEIHTKNGKVMEIEQEGYECTFEYRPERSKREDLCVHEWGSENYQDSSDSYYECNKCGHKMRCSELYGNIERDK